MGRIVAYLSDYTAALTFAELPGEVVHYAKRMLIDTLGCAIGGFTSEPSLVARALAGVVSSQQPATVLGSGQQTSLDLATFANGAMYGTIEPRHFGEEYFCWTACGIWSRWKTSGR
jgi:2-methylcitrate dehydratase